MRGGGERRGRGEVRAAAERGTRGRARRGAPGGAEADEAEDQLVY